MQQLQLSQQQQNAQYKLSATSHWPTACYANCLLKSTVCYDATANAVDDATTAKTDKYVGRII